jgi:WD40-like Beta Propeller Repeat
VDERNLGHLLEAGVLLYTREAAAILREVCAALRDAADQGQPLAVPRIENMCVTKSGQLNMETAPADPAVDPMPALASMIERVLPPSLRGQPDYAVPGSFRLLAPRALGWPPGLPRIGTPGELASAVARFQDGDAAAILQGLFARTAPPSVSASPQAVASTPIVREARPDVSPAAAASWTRGRRIWMLLASAILVSFTASYELTRRRAWSLPASSVGASQTDRAQAPTSSSSRAAPKPEAEQVAAPSEVSTEDAPADDRRRQDASPADTPLARTHSGADSPPPATPPLAADPRRAIEATSPSTPAPLDIPASTGPVFSPSFAASGSALVFHAGREPTGRLMSADLTDASGALEVVTLVGGSGRNYHPRLSPDGHFLAFDSDRDGVRGVYVANRDGTQVRRVSGPGFAAVPSWSPDMRWLAFVRAEPEQPKVWNLWLQERATGVLTRVTAHRYGQTWGAAWFPDSRHLCYSHETRLVVHDLDSGQTRTFASPRPGRLVRTPAVSPDGRRIAFQVIHDGVWLLDVDSGAMRRIVEDATAEEFAWDPTGRLLAYHSRQSGDWKIWIAVAPSDGTEP